MREILFRGKSLDIDEWAYGFYSGEDCEFPWSKTIKRANIIQESSGLWFKVDPKTVGEYTGLTDKNGVKIFEGDIIQSTELGMKALVQYFPEHGAFMLWCRDETTNQIEYIGEVEMVTVRVIGNIHDNIELFPEYAGR